MWFLLGFLGMVLGGIYGWLYWGQDAPPIVGAILFGVFGAGLLGWVMKDAAEAVDVSGERVFLIGVLIAVVAAIFTIRSGAPLKEVCLTTYLALVGGTGAAIHPKWVLVGGAFGLLIGLMDAVYYWWQGSIQTLREGVSLVLRSMVFFGLFAPTSWATYHRVWGKK